MQDEERVERVLAGLGKVEARKGLEERVLRGVRARVAESGGVAGWGWGVGAVAVAGVVLLVGGRWGGEVSMGRVEQARVLPTPRVEMRMVAPVVSVAAPLRHERGARRVVRKSMDEVAVREMLAASLPAPELPLTDEERLLRRVARKGEAEEVAMLDPMLREAREAKGKAEEERFVRGFAKGLFAGMTTGDNE